MKQQVLSKRRKISAELRIVKHHIIAIRTSSLKQAQVSLNLNAVTVSKTLILVAEFHSHADANGHAVESVGLRPLASWDCGFGFESRRPHECLSLVNIVCCHVEVSSTGRSLVQGSPTDCDASLDVI
jgi:hypothetical protein